MEHLQEPMEVSAKSSQCMVAFGLHKPIVSFLKPMCAFSRHLHAQVATVESKRDILHFLNVDGLPPAVPVAKLCV
jgi:hypothetical protein